MKNYSVDYLKSVLENKDYNSIEEGWFGTIMSNEFTGDSYEAGADFLEGKLDFGDVEFTSAVLGEVFMSKGWSSNSRWEASTVLFRIFDIDEYDESEVYSKAPTLLKYANEIGLPGDWEEKLEKAILLDNFKHNYKKINPKEDYKFLSTDKLVEIIQNKNYDVYDVDQVEILSTLVYYMTSEKRPSAIQAGVYDSTRQWNQLAINANMDQDVLNAIESGAVGWYADDESLEKQFDKVDMQDFDRQRKRDYAKHLANNKVTVEMVNAWNKKYKGILTFTFNKGFTSLDHQKNDSISIEFNGKEIYRDEGENNKFGNTSLDSTPILNLLKSNDYKAVSDIFLF